MMENTGQRHISRLTKDTYALVLAGGRGSRLYELTEWRAKPALYFGGKFRVIDFPLSNCINSGIRRVGVVTQYKAHSLIRHLVRGWGHFKKELGEGIEILPASQRTSNNWYKGTADAIFQNIDIIRGELPKYILILAGDHVYRQDYGEMLAMHAESGADMTVACIRVPVEQAAGSLGVMEVDENSRIRGFQEKPQSPTPALGSTDECLASMGNYVFNTDFLFDQLQMDNLDAQSEHDFGKDIIPSTISDFRVHAFNYRHLYGVAEPYWRDVGTLDSYWMANMELAEPVPPLNIYDERWPIWTYQEQLPPAKFVFDDDDRRGNAVDSLVASGCILSGASARKSVLFSNVRINSYSKVEESVIFPDVNISRHCRIRKAIIDTGCEIPEHMEIGFDAEADRAKGFRVTDSGVTLVTRGMLGLSSGGIFD